MKNNLKRAIQSKYKNHMLPVEKASKKSGQSRNNTEFLKALNNTFGILPNFPRGLIYTRKLRKESEKRIKRIWQ